MVDDLTVGAVRIFDDVEPQQGGTFKPVTRVRFFVGSHGPFERMFDRGADMRTIEEAIRKQKEAIARLSQL